MGKKGGSTTSTVTADPQTQEWMKQVWGAGYDAMTSPGAGPHQGSLDALDYYKRLAGGGDLGFRALTGDPGAFASFMNPYTSNVIDAARGEFGRTQSMVDKHIGDAATKAGAFGGSRHGVASGVAQAELGRTANTEIAGLLDRGYNLSMDRASQAANLGLSGAGGQAAMGEYLRNIQDPKMRHWMMQMQTLGALSPFAGQQHTQPVNRNRGAGFAGGAISGAGVGANFGPWGAAIGGGIGGLLGLL